MIPAPGGFHGRYVDGVLVFERPDDDLVIRYIERLRPVPSIEALWGDDVPSFGPPVRLVTDEGEHAWLVEGARDDERGHLTRFLGAVLGDDFVAVVEATTSRPGRHEELGALVEELLLADRHMLGIRRRPYVHDAPQGSTAEHHAPFYAYYRIDDVVVFVPPAIPRDLVTAGTMLASLGLGPVSSTAPVHVPLTGAVHVAIDDRYRAAFVLEDAGYFYAAVVEAPVERHATADRALAEVMGSVEAVPAAVRHRPAVVPLWLAY